MKNKMFSFIIIFLTTVLTTNISAHVVLDYPTGGENFQAGEIVSIQWHVVIYHGPSNWDIYFSPNGGITWQLIAESLPEAQLTYDWTAPNTQTNSGRIKVVQDNNTGSDYEYTGGNFSISAATEVDEDGVTVYTFNLSDAYPNPFNPTTRIRYSVPSGGIVKIIVFNAIGEEVNKLVDGYQPAGNFEVEFSANGLASGIYFYRIEAASFVETKKMILLK